MSQQYKILEASEMVKKGDEYQIFSGEWWKSHEGMWEKPADRRCRRPVTHQTELETLREKCRRLEDLGDRMAGQMRASEQTVRLFEQWMGEKEGYSAYTKLQSPKGRG